MRRFRVFTAPLHDSAVHLYSHPAMFAFPSRVMESKEAIVRICECEISLIKSIGNRNFPVQISQDIFSIGEKQLRARSVHFQ